MIFFTFIWSQGNVYGLLVQKINHQIITTRICDPLL